MLRVIYLVDNTLNLFILLRIVFSKPFLRMEEDDTDEVWNLRRSFFADNPSLRAVDCVHDLQSPDTNSALRGKKINDSRSAL